MTDGQNGTVTYAPVFSFLISGGETYTITADVGSNPPAFKIGQRVRVLYDKTNPANARLDSLGQLWFAAIIFGLIGPMLAFAGYLLLRFDRSRSQNANKPSPPE